MSPPAAPSAAAGTGGDAVLLIRAMVAAAAADGDIDEEERSKIMSKLEAVGLTEEERGFIERELDSPSGLDDIVRQAGSPQTAEQVYAVSCLAITVDTEAERQYMEKLAGGLGLDGAACGRIRSGLGIEDW